MRPRQQVREFGDLPLHEDGSRTCKFCRQGFFGGEAYWYKHHAFERCLRQRENQAGNAGAAGGNNGNGYGPQGNNGNGDGESRHGPQNNVFVMLSNCVTMPNHAVNVSNGQVTMHSRQACRQNNWISYPPHLLK